MSDAGTGARIRILPAPVAEQIAAGEVVERPASVVKELIENALDAGAHRISVELTEGGVGSIVAVDDGEGMGPEDAVVAFHRHATSKIGTAADLFRITTLGFRGEALAAIAAIADVRLVTRPRQLEAGTQVRVRGGAIVDVREVGASPGTRLEVRDLFFNTPARRKFLKAPGTEVGHVSELVVRCALAYPAVGFALRHGDRELIDFAAVSKPEDRLLQVFGRERAAAMCPLAVRGAGGELRGWVTDPHVNFPTARHVYTYVNGRFVKDRLFSHAVMGGYSTLLMQGRYPGAVLFLGIPPEEVDVNVHPAKAEVRFRRSGLVHELIMRGVSDRLRAPGTARSRPEAEAPGATTAAPAWSPGTLSPPLPLLPPASASLRVIPMPVAGALAATVPPVEPEPAPLPRPPAADPGAAGGRGFFASLRVVGQIFEGYLVCQNGDAMVLIDQHAAHERVVFERLRQAYGRGAVTCQPLLVPAVVELRPREAAVLTEKCDALERLGFEIEPFGANSFAVRTVPAILADANPTALLHDLVEEMAEVGSSRRVADAAEAVLARLACHSVVRIGKAISPVETQALLAAMDEIDFAGNCPHGRPAFLTFPRGELERRFRRA